MMRKAASMGLRDLVYRLYERRLKAALSPDAIPRHVGVMCDGNRRWAKSAGFRDVSSGHRKGADKIFELLDWCRESGDAVRSLLQEQATKGTTIEELAEVLDVEHIAEHLYTAGQPDPDLVIRTSGEQRLGGFLLWQSTHSEFYFCDAYWPAFRKVDFLRALRSYAARNRRVGT